MGVHIETISNATNHQTPINEADRRSNDSVQLFLQEKIYENYGYFYERKRGEYADGIRNGYIKRDQIIDREIFIRLFMHKVHNPQSNNKMHPMLKSHR